MSEPSGPETVGGGTILEELVRPVPTDEGDHEKLAHYVRKEKIVESAVTGTPVDRPVRQGLGAQPRPGPVPGLPGVQGDLRGSAARRWRRRPVTTGAGQRSGRRQRRSARPAPRLFAHGNRPLLRGPGLGHPADRVRGDGGRHRDAARGGRAARPAVLRVGVQRASSSRACSRWWWPARCATPAARPGRWSSASACSPRACSWPGPPSTWPCSWRRGPCRAWAAARSSSRCTWWWAGPSTTRCGRGCSRCCPARGCSRR